MIQRRAIRDEQKQQRREAILATAWDMFQTMPYSAIVMNDVAKQMNLAKGTLYLYFKTKEELFLALLSQQFSAWFDDLDQRLAAIPNSTRQAVVSAIGDSFAVRHGMTRLMAILHTVLEHNIEYTTMLEFKRMLYTHILHTGSLLEQALPFVQSGATVLMQAYVLVIGFEHITNPAPVAREVLAHESMPMFNVDFASGFSNTLDALLAGIEGQRK